MNIIGLFEDSKKNGHRMVNMSICLEARDTIGDLAEHSKFTVTQVKEIIKNKYMDVCPIELNDDTTIGEMSRHCNYTYNSLIKQIQKDIINTDDVDDISEKEIDLLAEYCSNDIDATLAAWKNIKRMTPEQESYILRFFEALRRQAYINGCSECIMCDSSRGCIDTSKQKLCDLLEGFFYEEKEIGGNK